MISSCFLLQTAIKAWLRKSLVTRMTRSTTEVSLSMLNLGPGLVNIQKAMENGPVEIVDFPMKPWVDFPVRYVFTFTGNG